MKQQHIKNESEEEYRNFGLKEDAFIEMLNKLKTGDETLFEKIFLSQFEGTISYLMHRYKTNRSSAYDATMDALLKFRRRLLEGKITYNNMRFLFTQMASQFLTHTMKKTMNSIDTIENNLSEDFVDEDLNLDYLDRAWLMLGETCSSLLESFYYKKIALKELAKRFGKSEVALRKQKQRCLQNLRLQFLKHYEN